MKASLIRILSSFVRGIAVLVLWICVGYGVAIGLRYAVNGMPDVDVSLSDVPGGQVVLDAADWVGRTVTNTATALNPVGYMYVAGGARTLCLLGTAGCTRADLNPPPFQVSGLLPGVSDQTLTWLAVGAVAAGLASVMRRRHG